jgi:hypothetical protein
MNERVRALINLYGNLTHIFPWSVADAGRGPSHCRFSSPAKTGETPAARRSLQWCVSKTFGNNLSQIYCHAFLKACRMRERVEGD